MRQIFHLSVSGTNQRGNEEMREWDKVRFLCLNQGVERFFSTLLRVVKNQVVGGRRYFKYGGCGNPEIAWNS